MRPLLAATINTEAELSKLRYPLIASPKLDGIRCIIHEQLGPVSRKLKPIPNNHIREILSAPELLNLDGEIMLDTTFNNIASAVMSNLGRPEFQFWVFDKCIPNLPYEDRINSINNLPPVAQVLEYEFVYSADDVLLLENQYLERGFEGIMLRDPIGLYKHNRSTIKEQILLKFKRFADAEGTITGYIELMHNDNEKELNELGYSKRSSHKHNQTPTGTLGSLIVKSQAFSQEFNIGTGFDEDQRRKLWEMRESIIGKQARFKYQEIGIKDKPRFPSFIELRLD